MLSPVHVIAIVAMAACLCQVLLLLMTTKSGSSCSRELEHLKPSWTDLRPLVLHPHPARPWHLPRDVAPDVNELGFPLSDANVNSDIGSSIGSSLVRLITYESRGILVQ